MSSKLTTFSYIQDSGENYWNINQVTTLANLIQNIQDGWYTDKSKTKIYLDNINYESPDKPPLWAVIKWISLWDGKTKIYNSSDIAKCVNGIKWRIAIIYEYYGERKTVDLSEVQSISLWVTIDRMNLMESDNQVVTKSHVTWVGAHILPGKQSDAHMSH